MLYSLRSRLMLSFSILLIIPFTAAVFIFSRESANLIQSSIESSTLQTIDQFASHADTLLMQIEDTGKQVLSSPFTQQWITVALNGGSSVGERYLAMQQLRNFFSSYTVNNSNIISVSAFREVGGGSGRRTKAIWKVNGTSSIDATISAGPEPTEIPTRAMKACAQAK
ncbi:hypothetical protein [Paenibacillus forsythiae]|uniref:hypothetical protein n=1 Tax=Paenibacillus forsythiae TaxID=365616 RepID=UPI001E353E36|nr:hypothetical protein [Paenibacillus forsythiae]